MTGQKGYAEGQGRGYTSTQSHKPPRTGGGRLAEEEKGQSLKGGCLGTRGVTCVGLLDAWGRQARDSGLACSRRARVSGAGRGLHASREPLRWARRRVTGPLRGPCAAASVEAWGRGSRRGARQQGRLTPPRAAAWAGAQLPWPPRCRSAARRACAGWKAPRSQAGWCACRCVGGQAADAGSGRAAVQNAGNNTASQAPVLPRAARQMHAHGGRPVAAVERARPLLQATMCCPAAGSSWLAGSMRLQARTCSACRKRCRGLPCWAGRGATGGSRCSTCAAGGRQDGAKGEGLRRGAEATRRQQRAAVRRREQAAAGGRVRLLSIPLQRRLQWPHKCLQKRQKRPGQLAPRC